MNAKKMNDTVDAFHNHLDTCQQCHDHPFDLCKVGLPLFKAIAGPPLFMPISGPTTPVSHSSDEIIRILGEALRYLDWTGAGADEIRSRIDKEKERMTSDPKCRCDEEGLCPVHDVLPE